ncbi:coiled-coil domain-containing protein mad1 [Haplosporangium sp. Z 11]|nr:coiled-coil domain-containing protein mad1 [Haplosporangium sp. Z 11]
MRPYSMEATMGQENDIQYSRTRSRTIEPEEYEQTRKRLKDTQYELSSMRTELERKIITMEQAARESDILKKKLMSRVDSLDSDRRFLYEREKSLTKKIEALEEGSIEFKTNSNEIIRNLREENLDLKERFSQLREQSRATESELALRVRTLTASLAHQEKALAVTQGASESQSHLAEEKHQQLAEAMTRIMELEDQNRQFRLNAQSLEDAARVERELKNQVAYIKQLEGTNRQLTAECKHYKEMYRNVEVLKEEKTGLEQKLKMLDDLRIKCGKLEVDIGVLHKEKQQWAAFLETSDMTNFDSPYKLAKTIASLRGDKAILTDLNGELEAEVKSQDFYILHVEKQLKELTDCVVGQEEYCKEQAALARRHERAKELALRQVESLKAQLKSYDTEEAQLMDGSYDAQKSARIEQLENLVQEYHAKLEAAMASSTKGAMSDKDAKDDTGSRKLLETIQDDHTTTFVRLKLEKRTLFEAKSRLEQEIEFLRKENAALDAKIQEHEYAIGAGAFNPVTSRVLELKDNPASRHQAVRQHMLDSLAEENAVLLKLVAQLQQQHQQQGQSLQVDENGDQQVELNDTGIIPAASFKRLTEEHQRLQTEMTEKDKRTKRLRQEWKLKSGEFLEAVRSLLGYKVVFHDNGQVELASVYNAQAEQSFLFTSGVDDEGTMQMVGSRSQEYMEQHKEALDYWVNRHGSIPAFLSRVTLDLVEKQAMQLQQQQQQQESQGTSSLQEQYQHLEDDFTQNSDMMMDM